MENCRPDKKPDAIDACWTIVKTVAPLFSVKTLQFPMPSRPVYDILVP